MGNRGHAYPANVGKIAQRETPKSRVLKVHPGALCMRNPSRQEWVVYKSAQLDPLDHGKTPPLAWAHAAQTVDKPVRPAPRTLRGMR